MDGPDCTSQKHIIDISAIVFLTLFTSIDNEEAGALARENERAKLAQEIELEEVQNPDDFETTEDFVNHYFTDAPVMQRVAWCESKYKHYEGAKGEVLRGQLTPADIGVMQINERYHGDTARKLGIDIYTLEGNVAYARYLYEKKGVKPWKASEHCWSNHLARR